MMRIENGMPAALINANSWRKSSFSGAVGNCVEIAYLADGRIALRNSRDPRGPALVHPVAGLTALLARACDGDR